MKRSVLLISFLAVAALCVAQTPMYMDFHDMGFAKTPIAMAGQYPGGHNLYWDNFLHVTPGLWAAAGPGFYVEAVGTHANVLFLGGPPQAIAVGSIEMSPGISTTPRVPLFQPISMTLSAGWTPNRVLVTAYLQTNAISNVVWNLTTKPQIFKFPPEWRNVTKLVFTPDPSLKTAVHPTTGSMVIYNFVLVER